MINYEQYAVSVSDPQVEDLVTVPEHTFQFVSTQRRMPPILTEQGKLGASSAFDFQRKQGEFALEADTSPVSHKSLTVSSIVS